MLRIDSRDNANVEGIVILERYNQYMKIKIPNQEILSNRCQRAYSAEYKSHPFRTNHILTYSDY